MTIRLNKFIANNSTYSRRQVDTMLAAGEIKVNNETITELGTQIDPETDQITINDTPLAPTQEYTYIALHKPSGYITTRKDELDRPTILDLLPPELHHLKPVGRLDNETEGLLIMTDDGEYINKVTHPKYQHSKTYLAIINAPISPEEIETLTQGIEIEPGTLTSPAKIRINKMDRKTFLEITIYEGRNRQIRKMFQKIYKRVVYLKRIRSGNINLGNLPVGKFRYLTKTEINDHKSN
ncbi:pseudouridine synthase [Candidatus Peregrinibacteria bacterium HGW-Peregrinibacteria-1]|jgi:23S rRNA pseudouridine2605 synthase|nr:MAG: pseudouridine synthase [Candidatus Peregrinibacteria bacterium HGW-Peregrinibacteria-1]